MLIPVLQELRAKDDYELVVLGLTTASEKLQAAGIPHIGYRHLVEEGDEEALKIGENMARELEPSDKVSREETVAYLGLSYQDLIDRLGKREAENQFKLHGRRAFLPLSVMERTFRKLQPDLVAATNSPRSEKAAILTARKMGIPAVCLMDLFDPREFEDRVGQPGYADRICVLSQAVKENLKSYGRHDDEIVVTGNPAFDDLAEPDLQLKAETLRSQRGWADGKVILWARQVNPNDWGLYETVESHFYDLLEQHRDWHLVIRLHPNDLTRFENLPPRVTLSTQKDDLATFLQASDVVITVNSTVGVQGVAIGKPLITIELGAASPFTPYGDLGFSIGIKDVNLLEASILKALGGFKASATLPKPGGAAHAVVEVMRDLLGD